MSCFVLFCFCVRLFVRLCVCACLVHNPVSSRIGTWDVGRGK